LKNEVHLIELQQIRLMEDGNEAQQTIINIHTMVLDSEIHILADIHLIYTLHPQNAQKCNNLNKFAGVTNRQPANKIINIKHQKALTYL